MRMHQLILALLLFSGYSYGHFDEKSIDIPQFQIISDTIDLSITEHKSTIRFKINNPLIATGSTILYSIDGESMTFHVGESSYFEHKLDEGKHIFHFSRQ